MVQTGLSTLLLFVLLKTEYEIDTDSMSAGQDTKK
jgi:hypothetical protein